MSDQPIVPYSLHFEKRVAISESGAIEAFCLQYVVNPGDDPVELMIRAEDWYAFAVASAGFVEDNFTLDGSHREKVDDGERVAYFNPPVP